MKKILNYIIMIKCLKYTIIFIRYIYFTKIIELNDSGFLFVCFLIFITTLHQKLLSCFPNLMSCTRTILRFKVAFTIDQIITIMKSNFPFYITNLLPYLFKHSHAKYVLHRFYLLYTLTERIILI